MGKTDDWIRLFKAKTVEELLFLETSTKHADIFETIKVIRVMNIIRAFRAMYEAEMKAIRDREAREDFVMLVGEDRMGRLCLRLIADMREKDIERAVKNGKYREQLYQEYKIFPIEEPQHYKNIL